MDNKIILTELEKSLDKLELYVKIADRRTKQITGCNHSVNEDCYEKMVKSLKELKKICYDSSEN